MSVMLTLCSLVIFTRNLIISVYTLVTIILIVMSLLGFLFSFLAWPFGAIEAIGVIIFVGMSVDYCLHVAHGYDHAHYFTRDEKISDMLIHVAASVVAAAGTTAGSTVFLWFCNIYIFKQLGIMMFANTTIAVLLTFFFLVPLLSKAGPVGHQGSLTAIFYVPGQWIKELRLSSVAPKCYSCNVKMVWSEFSKGAYSQGWHCNNFDFCGGNSDTCGDFRWWCEKCWVDYCTICHPLKLSKKEKALREEKRKQEERMAQYNLKPKSKSKSRSKKKAQPKSESPGQPVGRAQGEPEPKAKATAPTTGGLEKKKNPAQHVGQAQGGSVPKAKSTAPGGFAGIHTGYGAEGQSGQSVSQPRPKKVGGVPRHMAPQPHLATPPPAASVAQAYSAKSQSRTSIGVGQANTSQAPGTCPIQAQKETEAAIKIQSVSRGRTTRKQVKQQKEQKTQAAVKIQSVHRGKTARKQVQALRQ
eukprot:gnl/MRDRNA2_/MRDRNA2_143667_c0_seq1.p1 gnl/MRDRNA2_/MRDRNA2_143667_c0~~gnl/MRDRNA2_/MRDRNA2_143667_c0_seq1.p1  ORF type:complete len:512 (+),score=63.43 gnl/MRDRNA2_/MRDRNA2_143667_c0_seq1:129-1538(+)